MKPYIIINNNVDYDTYYYALYVGENLESKYPNSYHFYLYIEESRVWERHAFDKRVKASIPSEYDKQKFVEYVFKAKEWIISS